MKSPKQSLCELIETLTDEQAALVLQMMEHLVETVQVGWSAGILAPPTGAHAFAEFKPLIIPGQPASELLIAGRR